MAEIRAQIDGEEVSFEAGTTGTEFFKDQRTIIAMRVNGEAKDLYLEIPQGATVEGIDISSDEGLAILRHSCTHVMAQAVQDINPQVNLGIGPPVKDGFYYDFGNVDPFTPEDLKEIEKRMKRIVKEGQVFRRRVVSAEEAEAELADQPYKLHLISSKGNTDAEGASVEVGGSELTMYDNRNRKDETVWTDLCRGPHIPNTKLIGNGFKLMKTSAAYWLGNQANDQLQRIYGTAWPSKDELTAYITRLEEAERRDHRKLGNELDLFSFPDEVGSGLAVFHPKGGIVRMEMEEYSRRRHIEAGYDFVYTPHITKGALFEKSGHLSWYKDGMYPAMHLDEVVDEETGKVVKEGQDYYLKPMNCPMHNLIFASKGRSYRDLPLRLFEFGTVYRYEKSGVVHGLARGRGFTQDDAHIYCTREQMKDELTGLLEFVLDLLRDYGLDDFYLELSTKDPNKFVGDDATWEEATRTLEEVATASGLDLVPDPGGAAFYGPKISVQAKDAIGRTWQMSTIQLDFNLPERFELEYTAADGTRKRPVMIHRALFGSIERFFAVLTEHYAGAFPAWLAPVQVRAIPVADVFTDYLEEVAGKLRAQGIRVEVDKSDDRFGKKIRNASKDKIPFTLIAGGEDAEAGAVSFRFRDGSQDNNVPVDEAVARIVTAVKERRNN
ncbi:MULTISPECIES: threonine--tRNA ligase [unclassified Actinomyces]|uniref:threonine--tRNA ligase n=1 Tax=unclassified Actinomyces TaxID=2609248 RepID=UPI0008A3093A|nr:MULTISPECIES: threonine--tRNA ligase [unclassified Actinomyces]MDK8533562.1 threonine--tRNA ligase [Gleimia europaea]MDU5232057.1 threonine--tRNA ligase [Actinomyces sp.]MDU5568084.1 threonine--tRNA ligase [Actinomyces sp.]MDU6756913.1 threonine--tRNA ligase [Actinomyces sp.]MDU7238284.1 threonine--tRNA ligase [Actinomyces sp.]